MTNALAILERSFRPIALASSLGRGRHGRQPKRPYIGVYLLIRERQIVYIGSSVWMPERIWSHCDGRRKLEAGTTTHGKRFDRAMCLPLPASVIRFYEGALIRALVPEYTKDLRVGSPGYDAEILYGLGLRDELTTDDIAWQEVA